jgi:hypothetical protein
MTRMACGGCFLLALAVSLVCRWPVENTVRAEERAGDASPAPVVRFDDGKLSVDAHDVELSELLQQIAGLVGFQLTTTGQLRRVTAIFSDVPLEEGLRRLVQDHELMLVYRPPGNGRTGAKLVGAHVFAGTELRDPSQTAQALEEINQVLHSGRDERNVPRLSRFLSYPDLAVRARAIQALALMGGASAVSALERALSDQAPQVRLQAIYGLRRLSGVQAIPALADLLLRDPEVMVRRAAAGSLATLREPSATSALQAAANDPDPSVRLEVSRALQRHGQAVP